MASEIVEFVVWCDPVAQPRQRQAGYLSAKGAVRVKNYTPSSHPVNAFKARIQAEARKHCQKPMAGPIRLTLMFLMPRPESMRWKTKPMPRVPDTRKPDIDNLCKSVCDALNGIAFDDDKNIATLIGRKWIASGSDQPSVYVHIETQES